MAELDPSAFAKLLNDRLQVVAEDRANRERLEQLMTEVGLLKPRLIFLFLNMRVYCFGRLKND